RGPPPDVVLKRDEAARQLKMSLRQLQRLIAVGRIAALPSGIARAEIERYARTPQMPLTKVATGAVRQFAAQREALRAREALKAMRSAWGWGSGRKRPK